MVMDMKVKVRQQLLGNMIVGRCKQEQGIIFQDELCSGGNCIRFLTQTIKDILQPVKSALGPCKTGYLLQYEIYNDGVTLTFQLSVNCKGLNKAQRKLVDELIQAARSTDIPNEDGVIAVRKWEYTIGDEIQNAQYVLNEIFEYELPFFEIELHRWQKEWGYIIREFPKLNDLEDLEEGKEINVRLNRFERSLEARKKCIAHYGTTCKICGFDFDKVYGTSFHGIIEVHHIVPLSEIRRNYVVDPVRDLIPVCPNCHTALHSKRDGVYTPEELKTMFNSLRKNIQHEHKSE